MDGGFHCVSLAVIEIHLGEGLHVQRDDKGMIWCHLYFHFSYQ